MGGGVLQSWYRRYTMILVGISYEKKIKEHTCVIARVERPCRQDFDERIMVSE